MKRILIIFIIFYFCLISLSFSFPGMTKKQSIKWIKKNMEGTIIGKTERDLDTGLYSFEVRNNKDNSLIMVETFTNLKKVVITSFYIYYSSSFGKDDFAQFFENYGCKDIANDLRNAPMKKQVIIDAYGSTISRVDGKKYVYAISNDYNRRRSLISILDKKFADT